MNLFEVHTTRSILDQLLAESRIYKTSKDYKDLLDFVVRLRNFAPFNAMLLHLQKPGLSYAASARDWRERFGRYPTEEARPLLVLRPFGPVALVYDVLDTEGASLPEDVACFVARGEIDEMEMRRFEDALKRKNIETHWVDAGDRSAGLIRVVSRATSDKEATRYRININRNHHTAVQFATLVHELAHLTLGHLGPDRRLNIVGRPVSLHARQELEAESVAYIICARNGVKSKSETYLSIFVDENTTVDDLDVYQVMRAAGQVEAMLGLAKQARFDSMITQGEG